MFIGRVAPAADRPDVISQMATPVLNYSAPKKRRARVLRRAIAMVWFVVGAVVTYGAVIVIGLNWPRRLRGARVGGEWFPVHENDALLDMAALGIVAAVVVGLSVLAWRRRLRLLWAFVIGQYVALLAALVVFRTK